MSISTLAPYSGATFPRTAGSADAVASAGGDLDKHRLIFTTEELVLQRKLDFSVTAPKVSTSAPNGYTQGRSSVYMKFPLLLDNGNYTTNTIQLTFSADIETTDAEKQAMRDVAVQAIIDSSMDGFYNDLSVA